jgi:ethanolamine ammonia-lyase small subunit
MNLDPWHDLTQFTPARLALGRAGMSLPTQACLEFAQAHALARDAVHIPLDFNHLTQQLATLGYSSSVLNSQAITRQQYLQRPDLGRLLSAESLANLPLITSEVVIVIVDGLSSTAIKNHAAPFLQLLMPQLSHYQTIIHLIKHGRVAIADSIAGYYSARLCIVLIGERPGLSSPDSMGIYFTYEPKAGISCDAERNCISNIHADGLSYSQALHKLLFLITEAEKLKYSGVNLKDNSIELLAISEQANFLLD